MANNANGYNPMGWDCSKQGCFNTVKRPKIEVFAECLPGRIAFTDVDGIVEIGGNLFVLEWKSAPIICMGQRILFQQWTQHGQATVLIVVGNAQTMDVSKVAFVRNGELGPWIPASLQMVKDEIRTWAAWARAHKRMKA